ncbi:MAG TPA: porin [Burkholderiales bacterium]|nr:porin [Burkholderiales bacterium]
MRVPRKKKLLLGAVSAACALPALALAQAPAGVEIYGRANVSYERITVTNAPTDWEVVDNSSRIGFRGKKDLGDGLSAFFQIESRVRLDNGGDTFSSRDSYLGMSGGFGTARVGRTIGPVYYATYDYISNHNHDTGNSSDALLALAIFGNQGFMNNTVWYTSPKMGAFTVDVAYSRLGEARAAPGMSQPSYMGLVGAYDQGPLHVAVSHAETKNSADLGGGIGNKDTATTIGGLYNFGGKVIVGALYEKAKSDQLVGDTQRDYFRVSVMVPVAKHEFHVNLGMVDDRLDVNMADAGAKQYTLAYNYNVTKEFKLYAFYTVVDNEDNGNYGFKTNVAGIDNKSFAVGARYNF